MFAFSELIKKSRKRKGFTQSQLADLVGCSQNHIAQIETGRSYPSVEMLQKILNAVHLDTVSFLKETESIFSDSEKNKLYKEIFHTLTSLSLASLHLISKSAVLISEYENAIKQNQN